MTAYEDHEDPFAEVPSGSVIPQAAGDTSRARDRSPAFRMKQLDLIRDGKGRPVWNTANAQEIMASHPDWCGVFGYDEFHAQYMLLEQIPGNPEANFSPRELTDADITAAVVWFNRNGFPTATRTVVTDVVYAIASKAVISPVRHYLEQLSWDRVERIGNRHENWISSYCGADHTLYVAEAARRWLISAVARALQPGCKADAMLILEGKQGAGKSSALRALAGEDWFGDALPDMHGKDAATYLRGKWIVEIAELNAVRRAEIEQVKAFLSRQEERFRPPYGRAEVFEKRRCVFAGSTNRSDYLRDETGNRRFWPVRVGSINVPGLVDDRDQLWAEAVHAFRAGERWWLTGKAEREAAQVQAERHEDDAWISIVSQYLVGKSETSCKEVMGQAIQLQPANMGRAETLRVAGLLQQLGFIRDGKFTAGEFKDCARYRRAGE